MKPCPVCRRELHPHMRFCPYDGTTLERAIGDDDLFGVVIDGRFRIGTRIGEGSSGKVYRGMDVDCGRAVAIKVLKPHLAADRTALERFRREASAAGFIRHPNAIDVIMLGIMRDRGLPYIVMEYLTGVSLRDEIVARRRLELDDLATIMSQVCLALEEAHSHQVLHRDLKPDNVHLIRSAEGGLHVKVLDFGIAKLLALGGVSRLTAEGILVGTPYYMSPEQCLGEPLDVRSDVYSLGVIAYEAISGEVPFKAVSLAAVTVQHVKEAPRMLRDLRPGVPKPVEAVVLRALSKQREHRQQSARQFAEEFAAAVRG